MESGMNIIPLADYAAIVLAAGKGTRMRTSEPKALVPLLGEPMLYYVLAALEPLFCKSVWIVAGHLSEKLETAFPGHEFILQEPQLGTAHALVKALENTQVARRDFLLVINGDAPLATAEVIEEFLQKSSGCDLAFATITPDDPGPYGRVLRKDGKVTGIVEARDFEPFMLADFSGEVNAGIYLIRTMTARELLPRIANANKSGEYYLTDMVGLALAGGYQVKAVCCGGNTGLLGVNNPRELVEAEEILRGRIVEKLLDNGVIVHAPALVRCGPLTRIDPGCEIFGPCEIYGKTAIGEGSRIESHCVIRDCRLEKGVLILPFSLLDNAIIGENCIIGPYARLRPGTSLAENVHVGNFVELKKTRMESGAKANHLSYLGDSEIGARTNIGAGTITCNYDGKDKHVTRIGANSFIGSNTALVAPVTVGNSAKVGAGSVITRDVPEGDLAVARSRQQNLPGRGVR